MLVHERQKLLLIEPTVIIEYVKTSIEILLNLKMDTSSDEQSYSVTLNRKTEESSKDSLHKQYEEMLQKLENDIRNHIRVE